MLTVASGLTVIYVVGKGFYLIIYGRSTLFVKLSVNLLLEKLKSQLQVHGGYLAALDTLLIPKNGKRMSGVQAWKDHSGNANRGERLKGHHAWNYRIN